MCKKILCFYLHFKLWSLERKIKPAFDVKLSLKIDNILKQIDETGCENGR